MDYAILRRLEKRVLISCPDEENRINLFKKFLTKSMKIAKNFEIEQDIDYQKLAEVSFPS